MDFDDDKIDEYVAEALAATGTRKAPRPRVVTEREAANPFSTEENTAPGLEIEIEIEADEPDADAVMLVQIAHQLARGESAIEPLPRARAPRSTVDLEDEITNIVSKPR